MALTLQNCVSQGYVDCQTGPLLAVPYGDLLGLSADESTFRGKWPLRPRRSGVIRAWPSSCLRDTNQCRRAPRLAHCVSSIPAMASERALRDLLPAWLQRDTREQGMGALTATPLPWKACPANHLQLKQQNAGVCLSSPNHQPVISSLICTSYTRCRVRVLHFCPH
ncbi:hypothetical protein N431DRAFT_27529 [Stipitochalara longipes BDJ]|nr:hypothetical protein N431DRAFT_27529 [Stipitochalara longipes BDJ]